MAIRSPQLDLHDIVRGGADDWDNPAGLILTADFFPAPGAPPGLQGAALASASGTGVLTDAPGNYITFEFNEAAGTLPAAIDSRFDVSTGTAGTARTSGTGGMGATAFGMPIILLNAGQGASQHSEVVARAMPTGNVVAVYLQRNAGQAGYKIWQNSATSIQINRNGTFAQTITITSFDRTVNPSTLRASLDGSTGQINVYFNGALVGSYTDGTPLTGGLPGFGIEDNNATADDTLVESWTDRQTVATGGAIALAGAAVSDAAASGSLTTQVQLAGAAAALATASAALTTQVRLAGAAVADSIASGSLTTQVRLAGAGTSVGTASAGLTTAIRLASSAVADAAASGALSSQIRLAGSATATASATANLTTAAGIDLAGSAVADSVASGSLTTQIRLAGSAIADSSASASLLTAAGLTGSASATATATGSLTTGVRLVGATQERQNFIWNSQMNGAVVGVIGSGGAIPNGWVWNSTTGMVREVIAIGTLGDGTPYLDLRLSGTNTSGAAGFPDLYFQAQGASVLAGPGSQFTASVYFESRAGSPTGLTTGLARLVVSEHAANSGYLNGSLVNLDGTPTRSSISRTFNQGTVFGRSFISFATNAGSSVDYTFRIAMPQLERGLTMRAYLPNNTSAPVFAYDPVTSVASGSASLTTAISLAGAAVSDAAASGALSTQLRLAGAAVADSIASGALSTQVRLAGAALSQATASASITTAIRLAAAALADAAATGSLSTQVRLSGAATATASATGNLLVGQGLLGTAVADAAATGSLTTAIQLVGAASSTASASASLQVGTTFAGTASASASATGSLTTQVRLAGAATSTASASASLTAQVRMAGAAAATASGSASLSTQVQMAGAALALAGASGTLSTQIRLAGSAAAVASANGTMAVAEYVPAPTVVTSSTRATLWTALGRRFSSAVGAKAVAMLVAQRTQAFQAAARTQALAPQARTVSLTSAARTASWTSPNRTT